MQLISSQEMVTFLSTCGYTHDLCASGDTLSISIDNISLLDLTPLRDAISPFEDLYAGMDSLRSSSSSRTSHE